MVLLICVMRDLKLAPIDMNLFPAGFNNLNPKFFALSVMQQQKIIQQIAPAAKNILIIPESHTRNLFYWANIKTLQSILESAGFQVRFGLLDGGDYSIARYCIDFRRKCDC